MCSASDDSAAADFSDSPAFADVNRAIDRLTSLHDGDLGVVEAVTCGERAIPVLRTVLFSREPSGVYEPRRRAVEALTLLGADHVLIEFLRTPRLIVDPVEQTGEDAVINAAARGLATAANPEITPLLLEFTRRAPLAGIIEALGKRRSLEALPYFIRGLAEDFARPAAEAALRSLGPCARAALLDAAMRSWGLDLEETASIVRQRRSALGLFAALGPPIGEEWSKVHELVADSDNEIAVTASELCLTITNKAARVAAIWRLIDMLPAPDWLLGTRIEDCLVAHFDIARAMIEEVLRHDRAAASLDTCRALTVGALERVKARARAGAHRTRE